MTVVLETRDVTRYFGAVKAADHLSVQLQEGEIVGIVGPNGSGKTTFVILENMLIALSAHSERHWQFWRPLKTGERINQALRVLGQFGFQDGTHHRVSTLPEGGRKLLDVALSFALRPKLLLLDEPTSGVSVDEKFGLMDTLVGVVKDSGITTVFIEHDMDVVARYADRVIVFAEGSILADGQPDAVFANPEVRRHVLGEGV